MYWLMKSEPHCYGVHDLAEQPDSTDYWDGFVSAFPLQGQIGVRGLVFELFFLKSDTNIPAWYSSMLLALGAFLAFHCFQISRPHDWTKALVFFLLFGLLLVMSCDVITGFHKTIPIIVADRLGLRDINPATEHEWILLGGPAVILVFGTMIFLSWRTFDQYAPSLELLLGGFFVVVFGGVFLKVAVSLANYSCEWKCHTTVILFEETLEMAGTLLICASFVVWRDEFIAAQEQDEEEPGTTD